VSFRIEEKIVLTPFEMTQLQAELLGRGMTVLHPSRQIHSDYFETSCFRIFNDSEEGVLPRKKFRLRHYPKSPEMGISLETKISAIEGRFKTVRKVEAEEVTSLKRFGIFDGLYGEVMPKLTVNYLRSYFTLNGVRVTFDSHIHYAMINGTEEARDEWAVCELKAPAGTSTDYLHGIVEAQRRRFSKFSNGILALYRH
jgi:hypothetical protein